MKYDTILFDLDGTLTDPKEGITRSVQFALERFGIRVKNPDDLIRFIGPPLGQSFRDYYGFSEGRASEAIEWYREYFRDRGIYENRVYRGIPELLSDLSSAGLTLAVATSKPTVFAEQILRHFGLDSRFALVAGSNLDNSRSDKGEVIAYALSELSCGGDKTVMIGDRKHDIVGAERNGLDAAGVLYGYGGRDELTAAAPRYIVESVEELGALLLGN